MDHVHKQKALEEAVELTKVALSSPTGNAAVITRPESATKFLDDVYRKLCELWDESSIDD